MVNKFIFAILAENEPGIDSYDLQFYIKQSNIQVIIVNNCANLGQIKWF